LDSTLKLNCENPVEVVLEGQVLVNNTAKDQPIIWLDLVYDTII